CYNETLAGRRNVVEGKLMTSFVITAEGLVKKPKVEKKGTSVKDGKLNECVVAVLAAMQFPKPPDSREHPVAYPFNLKAEK
ncbi:MAG: AgmX/PglI C-terminal domain-containing protein, partial [Myxococcaceae bacterium]